jgi:pSer/pThr/pTyr-binding forkhead associated (FHA) protein
MKSPTIIVQLIHIQGPMKGAIQEFNEVVVTIGRHPDSTLHFPADLTIISRKHAEIRREGNQFKLVDFSANGTYVNGRKVTEGFLKDGDVLEFAEGGPKVSFLTRFVEDAPVIARTPAAPAVTPDQGEAIARVMEEPSDPPLPSRPRPSVDDRPTPEPTRPARPVPEPAPDVPVQKACVPLVIQYGPTIRSFRELPIVIGKNPKCDFVIEHPAILDRHAEVFHSRDRYWIKDLTGRGMVRLNNVPLEPQSALSPHDEFSLSPQGPAFSFLGEGRIMELSEPQCDPLPARDGENPGEAKEKKHEEDKSAGGFWSRLRKK